MKRAAHITMLMVLAVLMTLCCAKKPAGPRLYIDEPVFDFGEKEQGAKIFHAFSFKNTGTGKLEIKEVRPTCGCTVGDVNRRILEPGDTASVLITFNTEGYRGKVVKSIRIFTNQNKDNERVIKITGTVLVDLSITPRRLYVNTKYNDKAKTIEIKNHSTREIKLVNTVSERLEINVENPIRPAAPVTLQPGAVYKLFIGITPTFLSNEKRFSGNVRIFSDSRINPILAVLVNVTLPEGR